MARASAHHSDPTIRRRGTLVAVCLLAACAAGPDAWRERAAAAEPRRVDPMDADAVVRAGERVTYALEYADGGRLRTWTLELSLPEEPALPGHIDVRGPDPVSGFVRANGSLWGQLRDDHTRERMLRYSTNAPLRVRLVREDTGEEFTTTVDTQVQTHVWQQSVATNPDFGIGFLFRVLLGIDRLLDELLTVVQAPSIWSVIGNGMKVSVGLEIDDGPVTVETVDTPFGPLPAFWLPVTLRANGAPALECRLLITWRRSPLLLSCGVLRIEGRHPVDPSRCVVARLVGAERGVPEQAIDRGDLGGPGLRVGMTEAELLAAVGGTVTDRYRVQLPDGTPVDVVCLDAEAPAGHNAATFVAGRLTFYEWPGIVGRYLEYRGVPGPIYKPENRVGGAQR